MSEGDYCLGCGRSDDDTEKNGHGPECWGYPEERPAVSPGDLRARIEQLEQTNSGDERASNDWRDGYQTALDDVLALLGAAQEKS
jgi:hypothetical protein